MTLQAVLEQYLDHLMRLVNKPPTANRKRGIAYYRATIQTLQALIDAPRPEWYDLHFEKKLR